MRTARALDRLSAAQPCRAPRAARALDRWPNRQAFAAAQEPCGGRGRPDAARRVFARSPRCWPTPAVCLPANAMLSAIAHLEHADRQALHRLRVRLGPLDVFVQPLLKPAAQHWRAALLAVRTGQPMPRLPAAGAATLAPMPTPAARPWLSAGLGGSGCASTLPTGSRATPGMFVLPAAPIRSMRALATSLGLSDELDRPADGRGRLHQGRR